MNQTSFPIVEIFGFPPDNDSAEASACRARYWCPFLNARCTKGGHDIEIPLGTCGVTSKYGPIITCPERFKCNNLHLLDEVASYFFNEPTSVVYLSEVGPTATYTLDWALALVEENGLVVEYHGVEVQAIDITGSVKPFFRAYLAGKPWKHINHRYGINWANVFKRLMPQVLGKGAMMGNFGKKLGIVVQDQLLDYIVRSKRMVLEQESNRDLANIIFFAYKMQYDTTTSQYILKLSRVVPTSSRRLEAAFIAGILGPDVPTRDEFDHIVATKVAESGLIGEM